MKNLVCVCKDCVCVCVKIQYNYPGKIAFRILNQRKSNPEQQFEEHMIYSR
jgi:hypothetical protein